MNVKPKILCIGPLGSMEQLQRISLQFGFDAHVAIGVTQAKAELLDNPDLHALLISEVADYHGNFGVDAAVQLTREFPDQVINCGVLYAMVCPTVGEAEELRRDFGIDLLQAFPDPGPVLNWLKQLAIQYAQSN
ncbi:MAG: hypothetical protein COW24_00325 [Candidatus Kerfeldbacteria bacterium CG15_BIG_FIL_POST_REV_8_21_14_020_45_12]|uniref:Uncharacterized protein n=1 Tax=Candidatus Kerfeldbacteria bacterium CG15_BIG_FIL_POST_REV_8_21_14_020_45_12 TaxID=2014247 RepID=A0A2M7H578_9BACT|nr:MAG: hypothetical protein COW24_00325 [Candidatus Kerfeldbacteria bacterium CG15_BIG_FIL_POST_REV_8_21_14_020_45_12]PJA92810.1 MAG: hypothetical protein CO132_06075 [Candidatus Kerfeldbacteria bacterium CG_4_9_14_3_um_filter_45_8]